MTIEINGVQKFIIGVLITFTIASVNKTYAHNPIIQTKFIADPAPMIYNGSVLLYMSHDEDFATGFNMFNGPLYNTTVMVNWTDHGIIATVKGPYRTFKWADGHSVWSSQCIARNERFYLYCPTNYKNKMAIGVTVSNSFYSPFIDALGKPLISLFNTNDYAPTMFIDTDGQACLHWGGNGLCFYVRLNKNIISTSSEIQIASIDFAKLLRENLTRKFPSYGKRTTITIWHGHRHIAPKVLAML